jgi:hypothetical protein
VSRQCVLCDAQMQETERDTRFKYHKCPECGWEDRQEIPGTCSKCGGETFMDSGCGAHVCVECDNHEGLARCYCGWSASGGNGYAELVEMGETIEPDDY